MNKIKIAFISNTFVWSCAICWKKLKNHAISPRITHFLLLTGFGDFPRGSETVSAGFWRLFHGVHGRLAFPLVSIVLIVCGGFVDFSCSYIPRFANTRHYTFFPFSPLVNWFVINLQSVPYHIRLSQIFNDKINP